MNSKGVSLISLAITIIVIIILAGIAIYSGGFKNMTEAQRSAFMTDLEQATLQLRTYNERAMAFSSVNYKQNNLQWDGSSLRGTNTAKMQNNVDEDEVENYILERSITNNLKNKIYIKDGKLYIKEEYRQELEWAQDYYTYMKSE